MQKHLFKINFNYINNLTKNKILIISYKTIKFNNNNLFISFSINLNNNFDNFIFFDFNEKNSKHLICFNLYKYLLNILEKFKNLKIDYFIFYRDGLSQFLFNMIKLYEVNQIKNVLLNFKNFNQSKFCLINVGKNRTINFFNENNNNILNNDSNNNNIKVGSFIEGEKNYFYNFYINSNGNNENCFPTHYTIIYNNLEKNIFELIPKLTFDLTFLSHIDNRSINIPAPLYFIEKRSRYSIENFNGEINNKKYKFINLGI